MSVGFNLHFSVLSYRFCCGALQQEPTVPRFSPLWERRGFCGTNASPDAAPAPHPHPPSGEETAEGQRKVPRL